MEDAFVAPDIAETRRRLKENREWVEKWLGGNAPLDPAELRRRHTMISEDQQLLRDLGVTDATGPKGPKRPGT